MKVAVMGYGTIGKGVYELLQNARGLEPGPVLVRSGKVSEPFQVTALEDILSDPQVEAVVEVLGGTDPTYAYAKAVLESGRHLVTANKELATAYGLALDETARAHGAAFLFSAACGGGIPLLTNLALAAGNDAVLSVSGILNGTTNYILDAMQSRGLDYASALAETQTLGYAENDPAADVDGLDAARKISLASAVVWGKLPVDGIHREGIDHLTPEDVADIRDRGYTLRLMAACKPEGDTVSAWVEPALFPAGAPECAVRENYNLAKYVGKYSGPLSFIGQGAGRYPTASMVLRDLRSTLHGRRRMLPDGCAAVTADNSREYRRYYLRLPAGARDRAPIAELLHIGGDVVRGITGPIPVARMHSMARELRRSGIPVFFAAVEE